MSDGANEFECFPGSEDGIPAEKDGKAARTGFMAQAVSVLSLNGYRVHEAYEVVIASFRAIFSPVYSGKTGRIF